MKTYFNAFSEMRWSSLFLSIILLESRTRFAHYRSWNSKMYPVWRDGDPRYRDCWKGIWAHTHTHLIHPSFRFIVQWIARIMKVLNHKQWWTVTKYFCFVSLIHFLSIWTWTEYFSFLANFYFTTLQCCTFFTQHFIKTCRSSLFWIDKIVNDSFVS